MKVTDNRQQKRYDIDANLGQNMLVISFTTEGGPMSEMPEKQPIPRGQEFLDNIGLLFLLSLLISGVLYNLWGLIDLFRVPRMP